MRDAAGVSLRTLYKYLPSRADMVLAALEHRHRRYMARVLEGLPHDQNAARAALMDRVGDWMQTEAAHKCLFHSAVAADPGNPSVRALLERHKHEVAQRAAAATGLAGQEIAFLMMEGLTQTWPLHAMAAVTTAKAPASSLPVGQARKQRLAGGCDRWRRRLQLRLLWQVSRVVGGVHRGRYHRAGQLLRNLLKS